MNTSTSFVDRDMLMRFMGGGVGHSIHFVTETRVRRPEDPPDDGEDQFSQDTDDNIRESFPSDRNNPEKVGEEEEEAEVEDCSDSEDDDGIASESSDGDNDEDSEVEVEDDGYDSA
jgi:hypothetical protein